MFAGITKAPPENQLYKAVPICVLLKELRSPWVSHNSVFNCVSYLLNNKYRGPYRKHLLTEIFGSASYRGPHRFLLKNRVRDKWPG